MNALERLAWALPLVLVLGVGAMILLRRIVVPASRRRAAQRLVARESLVLSEQTRVHLVEVDGSSYLVVESTKQATVQSLPAPASSRSRAQPAWLRRLSGATR